MSVSLLSRGLRSIVLASAAVLLPGMIRTASATLILDLNADNLPSQIQGLQSGDAITTWNNSAPGGILNFSATGANNTPKWYAGQVNGHAVVRFDGNYDQMISNDYFPAQKTAYNFFFVLKRNGVSPAYMGMSQLNGGADSNHYAYSGGVIYETTGRTTRPSIGTAVQSIDNYHVYAIQSAPNFWRAEINGQLQSETLVNTVEVDDGTASTSGTGARKLLKPLIGATIAGTQYGFIGDFAEIRVYEYDSAAAAAADYTNVLNSLMYTYLNVPEPSTLAVLALGGLMALRRRS